jgi:hypothetical protein
MEKKGLYGNEKKTIMGGENCHNNTLSIYCMAIYGICHYFFGTPG